MKSLQDSVLLLFTTTLALAALSIAQTPLASPDQTGPAVKDPARVTLLDLVIRDKKGRLINDLEPSNVTVTDNGAKQSISEFRLIQGTEAIGAGGAKVTLAPLHQVRLVTLVFETMADADLRGAARNAVDPLAAPMIGSQSSTKSGGTQGANSGAEADRRRTAQKAALEFFKTAPPANVYYSVVLLNTQLLVVQPFTQDTAALAKAVERATSGAGTSDVTSDSNRIKAELSRFAAERAQRGSGAGTPADVQTALARTMLEMSRSTTANAGGPRLTIDALQSLSRGLSGMPGRKEILYFSSGLLLPTHLDLAFSNLKGLANRANVAIYPVDTRGPGASDSAGAQALNSALAASASDDIRAAMHASDAVESAGRANVQLPLRELAEDTGGFLIAESNNLAAPLRRAVEDVNSYYEITYDPGITEYDGSFRKVKVDIARKGAVSHSRSGYLSLAPDVRASSVQPFEVPLLKALSVATASKDVDYLAEPVLLRSRTEGTDLSVLIEIPLHALQAKTDPAQTTVGISFALAALLKDNSGEVVQKLTREHALQVTAEQMKAGNFVEKLAATVPSGKYTLESAVMDRTSGKVGTQRAEFSVAPKSKGVGISSLTPVRSYAPNAKNLSPDEPFQFQGGTITPMLSNTVTRSEKGVLPLFFTVYPDPSIAGASTVDIEFFQNGKSLQKGTLPLPAPDAQGRIPYVFSVPAAIPPGDYEIHATARQGGTSSEAKTLVKVEAQ